MYCLMTCFISGTAIILENDEVFRKKNIPVGGYSWHDGLE